MDALFRYPSKLWFIAASYKRIPLYLRRIVWRHSKLLDFISQVGACESEYRISRGRDAADAQDVRAPIFAVSTAPDRAAPWGRLHFDPPQNEFARRAVMMA
jgi:hypothetical protein